MLISDTHRFLFVHVQKTGGSTIDNGLTTALGDVRRISAANRGTIGDYGNLNPPRTFGIQLLTKF